MCILYVSIGKCLGKIYQVLSLDDVIIGVFIFLHTFFQASKFSVMSKCYFCNLKFIFLRAGRHLAGKGLREGSRGGKISLVQHPLVRGITDGTVH